MPGPTPINASHRAVFKYTVDNLLHKMQLFTIAVPSADPTGWDLTGRPGHGNAGFSNVPDAFFNLVKNFYSPTPTVFIGTDLYHRSGTTWIYVVSAPTTIVPAASGGYDKAMGWCTSGKDDNNRRIPSYFYEGQFGPTAKYTSYTGATSDVKAVIDYFFNVGLGAGVNTAWNWSVARNGIAQRNRWLANVIDSNEKLRRIRRIK